MSLSLDLGAVLGSDRAVQAKGTGAPCKPPPGPAPALSTGEGEKEDTGTELQGQSLVSTGALPSLHPPEVADGWEGKSIPAPEKNSTVCRICMILKI